MKFINLKSISISLATLLFVASLAIVGCGKKNDCPEGQERNDQNQCVNSTPFTSGLRLHPISQDAATVTLQIVNEEDADYILDENAEYILQEVE